MAGDTNMGQKSRQKQTLYQKLLIILNSRPKWSQKRFGSVKPMKIKTNVYLKQVFQTESKT